MFHLLRGLRSEHIMICHSIYSLLDFERGINWSPDGLSDTSDKTNARTQSLMRSLSLSLSLSRSLSFPLQFFESKNVV